MRKREKFLQLIVEKFNLKEGVEVYTIIPNKIVGNYGKVGIVRNGSIELTISKSNNIKGEIRMVEGFLSRFINREVFKDLNGNIYFIDGKPVTKDANLFKLTNGQYYFINGANIIPEFSSDMINCYFSKAISKVIDKLLKMFHRNINFKRLIQNFDDLDYSLMDFDNYVRKEKYRGKYLSMLDKLFRNEFNSNENTRLICKDWTCPCNETGNSYTIYDAGLYLDNLKTLRTGKVNSLFNDLEYGLELDGVITFC